VKFSGETRKKWEKRSICQQYTEVKSLSSPFSSPQFQHRAQLAMKAVGDHTSFLTLSLSNPLIHYSDNIISALRRIITSLQSLQKQFQCWW
jgi:hypothetical protein